MAIWLKLMRYKDYYESTHRYRHTLAQIYVGAAAAVAAVAAVAADRTFQRC